MVQQIFHNNHLLIAKFVRRALRKKFPIKSISESIQATDLSSVSTPIASEHLLRSDLSYF